FRGYQLGLGRLDLRHRRHVPIVERGQIVEIQHTSVCADLVLVPDRQRRDHLDPASLARPLIENDTRAATIISFDARGRLYRTCAFGSPRCWPPALDNPPGRKNTHPADNG